MPVTARLSKRFYDKFGDEIANEFVDWFNQVDATYRSEFRDLFQTNFAQFDAKLEQRVGELHAKLDQRIAEVKGELRAEMHAGFGALGRDLERQRADLMRWMFIYWAGSVVTTVVLVLTVVVILR